jgi:hypothetical protein
MDSIFSVVNKFFEITLPQNDALLNVMLHLSRNSENFLVI